MSRSDLLQHLPGAAAWDLVVVESARLTPSMHRLLVSGDRLEQLHYLPGQDLMVEVPDSDGGHYRRRYTIRSAGAGPRSDEARLIELQVVVHGDGDGPGARWAAGAGPGDRFTAIGPRGKVTVNPDVDWHLFAGDESALPATFAMVESLPAGSVATVILEVAGPEDEQPVPVPEGCSLTLRWLHRQGRPPGTADLLAPAVAAAGLPSGSGQAYLAGELGEVAAMRQRLEQRNMAPEQISSKPYWRRGVANAPHGEPPSDPRQ